MSVTPLTVSYEDYTKDRVGHLNRIVELLDASRPASPLEDRLHVMQDERTARIAARFRADLYQVPDPILVRSISVAAPNPQDETTWADRARPAVAAPGHGARSRVFGRLASPSGGIYEVRSWLADPLDDAHGEVHAGGESRRADAGELAGGATQQIGELAPGQVLLAPFLVRGRP
jgi:hypothetical protein